MNYWHRISERYHLNLSFVNDTYDPQFTFMNYDHDGKVRMDCSSAYVMSAVTGQAADYRLILANDPDYDRFGIVCGTDGMITANAFLTVAAHYLMTHRHFDGLGIAKTVVTTDMLARAAKKLGVPLYEVPVGFKYFGPLYEDGKIAFSGEESAGASFIAKDGSVWTTDKDGIILCLLAAEIYAVTGKSPLAYYEGLCNELGRPFTVRSDAPATLEEKDKISSLTEKDVTEKVLCGSPITAVLSRSPYGNSAIGGVKITTDDAGSQPARRERKTCISSMPKVSSPRNRPESFWKKGSPSSARLWIHRKFLSNRNDLLDFRIIRLFMGRKWHLLRYLCYNGERRI